MSLQEKEQRPLHLACARSGNNAVAITSAVLRATSRNLRLQPDKVSEVCGCRLPCVSGGEPLGMSNKQRPILFKEGLFKPFK